MSLEAAHAPKEIRAHWFRRDLRLTDHPIWAGTGEQPQLAVVFEPGTTFEPVRKFWRECIEDLQRRTPQVRWFILKGDAASAWRTLVRDLSITRISTALSWNHEEKTDLEAVEQALPGIQWSRFRDQCLHDPDELQPGPIQSFTPFYKRLEGRPLPWKQLSAKLPSPILPAGPGFPGGEQAGLGQLLTYLRHPDGVAKYHDRRNGMLDFLDSSKLSPWLAWGCLSPLRVAHEISRCLEDPVRSEGAKKLLYELYWREFFKQTSLQLGPALFALSGVRGRELTIRADDEAFTRWTQGETGQRFNDAHMRELLETGWMSNRGRQNVASFWAKILQGDWRWGARWFAQQLIDHDPESNWGNWQYLAGVGFDPRDRVFNLERQAEFYDPDGAYQRRWLKD